MLNTLKNLGLALINATLILVALCLFLTWNIVDKADHIASNVAQSLISVQPLRQDIQGATIELAALRNDLAQISEQSDELRSASLQRVQTRVEQMQEDMENARQSLANLSQAPTRLVDHAIETAADQVAQGINDVRGCVPPES